MTYQVDILVSAKLSHKELGIIIHQETVISEKCVIYEMVSLALLRRKETMEPLF